MVQSGAMSFDNYNQIIHLSKKTCRPVIGPFQNHSCGFGSGLGLGFSSGLGSIHLLEVTS